MSDAPAPTRAEEGREAGQDDLAARFALEERTALIGDLTDLQACLSVDGRAHSSEIVARAVVALTAAEAEVARLKARLEIDHAYDGAGNRIPFPEGMDHLDGIACRDETIKLVEAEVARLRERVATLEAEMDRLRKDNERLRWRHPAVLPDWNDLPDGLRAKLDRAADGYDPDWGGDLAVNMYATLRQAMMEAPHADN